MYNFLDHNTIFLRLAGSVEDTVGFELNQRQENAVGLGSYQPHTYCFAFTLQPCYLPCIHLQLQV
jgi:hypothetical protein